MTIKNKVEQIVEFLRVRIADKNAILELDETLNSYLTAALCAEAVTGERVIGVLLPTQDVGLSPTRDRHRNATAFAAKIGIGRKTLYLSGGIATFGNIQGPDLNDRVKAAALYAYAQFENGVVIGGLNKMQITTGNYSKFGQNAVDLLPIAGLYPSEVRAAAELFHIDTEKFSITHEEVLYETLLDAILNDNKKELEKHPQTLIASATSIILGAIHKDIKTPRMTFDDK